MQALEQSATEIVDVLGAAVGKRVLGGMPSGLDGVELGSVGGQAHPDAASGTGAAVRARISGCGSRRRPTRRSAGRADDASDTRGSHRFPPERYASDASESRIPAAGAWGAPTARRSPRCDHDGSSGERWGSARRAPRCGAPRESS